MKKIFYLCAAALLFTTVGFAQKITGKDLEGNWKMTTFTTQGITFNLETEKVMLTPEMQEQIGQEGLAALQEGMKQSLEPIKTSYINFKGTAIKLSMGTETESGVYTLIEKNGTQVLSVKSPDGEITEMPVSIKDKKLNITMDDEDGRVDLSFKRE